MEKEGPANQPTVLDKFCTDYGFVGWFETSAKENIGIQEAMQHLVKNVFSNFLRLISIINELSKNFRFSPCNKLESMKFQ